MIEEIVTLNNHKHGRDIGDILINWPQICKNVLKKIAQSYYLNHFFKDTASPIFTNQTVGVCFAAFWILYPLGLPIWVHWIHSDSISWWGYADIEFLVNNRYEFLIDRPVLLRVIRKRLHQFVLCFYVLSLQRSSFHRDGIPVSKYDKFFLLLSF